MFNPFKRKKSFDGYVIDLGKLKSRTAQPAANTTASTETADSSLGFLGSMASASSEGPSYGTSSSNEMENKISSIAERLYKILDRLDLLEHKMDRIERKIGLKEEY